MSTADPIGFLLADVDRPVQPRPEFVEGLLSRLLEGSKAPEIGPPVPSRAWTGLLPKRSGRRRFALVAIALGLLLAGVATAMYLSVRLVFETSPSPLPTGVDGWSSFALSADGRTLYAIRVQMARRVPPGAPQLMAIDLGHGRPVEARLVLDFATLSRPGAAIQTGSGGHVSVAPNGDLFLVVPSIRRDSLFVLHRDGSHQAILDGRELIRTGLFPAAGGVMFQVAASTPTRIWLLAEPGEGDSPQRLFELVDPNGDGKWGDRVLRAVAVPAALPLERRWRRSSWNSFPGWRWQLAPEPLLSRRAASGAVLAATVSRRTGDFRIYRIVDINGDADVVDPGEATLVSDRPEGVAGEYPLKRSGVPPQISPLVVAKHGRRQVAIAVAGLTDPGRISLVSESGTVTELPYRFPSNSDWPATGLAVASDPEGELYAVVASRRPALVWRVYRVDTAETRGSR